MRRTFITLALLIVMPLLALGLIAGQKTSRRNMQAKQELTRLEEEWHNACVRHDAAALDRILADEYITVSSNGGSSNKAQSIEGLKADTATYEYSTPYDLDMRFYGDTTVVVGRTKEKGRNKSGAEFTAEYRWTDVFVKRAGRWQCVAAQVARVPPPQPQQASTTLEQTSPLAEQVDEFIKGLVAEDKFSGVVLVARDGTPIFKRAYGLASKEFNVPNRVDTKFNLASMTKMFTGVAIARMRRGDVNRRVRSNNSIQRTRYARH